VFANCLMGTDSVGRTLLSMRTREKLKVKVRVVLRFVGFHSLCRKNSLSGEKRSETKQSPKKKSGPHNRRQPSQPYG